MCRLGITKLCPGDTGKPSRIQSAWAFCPKTRSAGSEQNGQDLVVISRHPIKRRNDAR